MLPTTPAAAPRIGAEEEGPTFGKIQERHGVSSGTTSVICPENPVTAPWRSGMFSFCDASFKTYRVSKLSMQSMIRSAPSAIRKTESASIFSAKETTRHSGLSAESVCAADSAFSIPRREAGCRIWRFKLDSSITSKSAIRISPTPASARYIETGEPRPPAPAIKTVDSARRR